MLRLLAFALLALASPLRAQPVPARYTPEPYVKLAHPAWSKDAILYELNTRNFTPEGTFAAAAKQLPRLKALGVDIVWLMPIHPIGVEHRKGTLGSPYSVRDYRAVNPEFGTLADLQAFVAAAHAQGMHVILDWVANHTAWDNPLHAAHPDWYEHDWKGANRPTPWWDWEDVIDLDYASPGLRQYMTDAMAYWVRTADIDGFRCDVAGYVPLDFWENARAELDAINRRAARGLVVPLHCPQNPHSLTDRKVDEQSVPKEPQDVLGILRRRHARDVAVVRALHRPQCLRLARCRVIFKEHRWGDDGVIAAADDQNRAR